MIVLVIVLVPATVLAAAWFWLLGRVTREDWVTAAYNRVLDGRLEEERLRRKDARREEMLARYHGVAAKVKAGEYKEKVEELWKDMAVFKTDTVLRPDYFVCVGPRVCDYSAVDLDQVMLLMDLDIMDREPDEEIIVVASVNDVR